MAATLCPRCGAQNAANDVFCSKCGTTLSGQPTGVQSPSPQVPPPAAAPSQFGPFYWAPPAAMPALGRPYPPGTVAPGELQRPTAAMVLAIVGGVFIIAAAILEVIVGTQQAQLSFGFLGGTYILSGLLGIAVGILVLVFGVLVYVQPQHHVVYGVLILVFAVVSLVSFFGGVFIGFVLGLIGGILAIVHRPFPPQPMVPFVAPPIQRVCPKCGRVIDPTVKFCPHCGNQLG